MEELVAKLREGGVESVPADDIDDCGDERCADITGACGDKVGTCWVEARCGGGGGRARDEQVGQETSFFPSSRSDEAMSKPKRY